MIPRHVRNISGLPFYDVILLTDLPKSASLPVATVQQSKARIMDGRWDFDYLYFTESDQVFTWNQNLKAKHSSFPSSALLMNVSTRWMNEATATDDFIFVLPWTVHEKSMLIVDNLSSLFTSRLFLYLFLPSFLLPLFFVFLHLFLIVFFHVLLMSISTIFLFLF